MNCAGRTTAIWSASGLVPVSGWSKLPRAMASCGPAPAAGTVTELATEALSWLSNVTTARVPSSTSKRCNRTTSCSVFSK